MWDGLFMLLTLSAIMAIASFFAGILPLSVTLSPRQLRFISFLGTGVLVGTSLIVIIPEGVEALYSAAGKGHSRADKGASTVPSVAGQQKGVKNPPTFNGIERAEAVVTNGFEKAEDMVTTLLASGKAPRHIIVKRTPEGAPEEVPRRHPRMPADSQKDKQKQKEKEQKDKDDSKQPQPQKGGDDDSTEGHKEGHTRVHAPEGEETKVEYHQEERDPHAYIGVALVLGFILMFLIDHLPTALSPSKPRYQALHISLSNLSRGPHNASTASLNDLGPPSPMPGLEHGPPQPQSSATTIGLVIHACADGIALGASSTAPSTSLSLIIFLAIMLHKAPAAFGLTTVLLKQGLSKRTARTHLIMFSLAAPAGAVFTWAVVHALGRARLGGDDGLMWTTGWVLLFSGGTFLYVAMHSMIETTSFPDGHMHEQTANGYIESHRGKPSPSKSDIATALVGMLIPLLTQVGH